MTLLLAGLGNPGKRYAGTRHNVGFALLNLLSRRYEVPFVEAPPWKGEVAKLELSGQRLVMLKPTTFMNLSGKALAPCAEELGISPGRVLVVSDETQIPVGKLKLSSGGSDGGHNGLASIIHELGTRDFRRLRLGVGQPPPGLMKEWVLRPFHEREQEMVGQTLALAAEAVEAWAKHLGEALANPAQSEAGAGESAQADEAQALEQAADAAFAKTISRFNSKKLQPLEIKLAAEREAEAKRLQAEAEAEANAAEAEAADRNEDAQES